jgi:hypothetical protein
MHNTLFLTNLFMQQRDYMHFKGTIPKTFVIILLLFGKMATAESSLQPTKGELYG